MTLGPSQKTTGSPSPLVVIVNHRFENTSIERAILAGNDVVEIRAANGTDIAEAGDGIAAILVTSKPTLDAAAFDALPNLRVVVRYGIGVDNIDVQEALRRGIVVCNVTDYGTDEVATHALTLALASVRRVFKGVSVARAGGWTVDGLGAVPDVREATFGVVGFGRIGRAVAGKALALGFHVIVHDDYVDTELIADAGAEPVGFDDMLVRADVMSLHAPLTDETRELVDSAALGRMKPTAFIINTSRGGLIDEDALVAALDEDRLAGAALDVLSTEPPAPDAPLLHHERVIVTPHVAWYSQQAMERLQRQAAEQVAQALAGEVPANVVQAIPHARRVFRNAANS